METCTESESWMMVLSVVSMTNLMYQSGGEPSDIIMMVSGSVRRLERGFLQMKRLNNSREMVLGH